MLTDAATTLSLTSRRPPPLFKALTLLHLFNLDAVAVAILWQWLFARSLHEMMNVPAAAALGMSVWLIYVWDRLADTAQVRNHWVSQRHAFHHKHRKPLLCTAFMVFAVLLALSTRLPLSLVRAGLLLAGIVMLYLACVHALPHVRRPRLPKELLVGLVFSCGVCISPALSADKPALLLAPALMFAALCCLNCVAIEIWEWQHAGDLDMPSPFTFSLFRALRPTLWTIAAVTFSCVFLLRTPALYGAIFLGSVAFLVLDGFRTRLSVHHLRILCDLPLFSPALVLAASAVRAFLH